MRILFLTPRFPFPLIGGDRIKSYHMLKHLAKTHEVSLVSFNHGGMPTAEQVQKLKDINVAVYPVPLNPIVAGLMSAKSVVSNLPLEVAFYTQGNFRSIVQRLMAEQKFDVGISFFMRTAEYLRSAPVKKILVAEDCRTLYQSRSAHNAESLLQKIVRRWEVFKLKSYEPSIVDYFDTTTLVTNTDIEHMKRQNPRARYRLLTNGVEIDEYRFRDDHEQRRDIMFLGKLDYLANEFMALKIARDILPLIHKQLPDVRVHIVGSNPRPSIRRYESEHVIVHADVPDIELYYHQNAVFLHPHAGASGIQNKLLQAMAMGCAVVTTPTGLQGNPAVPGKDVLIGTTDEELAQHCVALLRDPVVRSTMARSARALIEATHSWEAVFRSLDEIIAEVMAAPQARL